MNLAKLFEMQRKLDAHIEKEHPREPGEDRLAKKILALQVELGELANELPEVFKFWSHKKNNYERALKEYVDCLHFILSIGLEEVEDSFFGDVIQIYPHYDSKIVTIKENTVIKQFNSLFLEVGLLSDTTDDRAYDVQSIEDAYANILGLFFGLGEILGFEWEEIEQAYLEKNKINHHRQEVGY
ncbi:dUTP diphosphatase [Bacillus smithii]|uniref:dUTP diphosphatase n=1 Tax=Bacillus smithii TaxID=1479 RepID=UPI003D238FCE